MTGVTLVTLTSLIVSLLGETIAKGDSDKQSNSGGVGCFSCHSVNGSDPGCSDPFDSANTIYMPECKQGISGRMGLFPAYYCVKMNGKRISDGMELIVRTCTQTNMHYQCGIFKFDDEQYKGCLATCSRNGCNYGNESTKPLSLLTLLFIMFISMISICNGIQI